MKKYISWFGLLPITIILMGFLTEDDLSEHTERTCFGLLLTLVIFIIMYFMLLYLNIKKWVALIIAAALWIVAFFVKRKIYG